MSKFILVLFLVFSSLAVASQSFAQAITPAVEVSQMVNINTADASILADRLNGVGLARAAAIVRYREQHGAFGSVDELTLVEGIGAAILANNRHLLTVE